MLFGLSELAQESELSVQVSSFHAILEFSKRHSFFYLGNVFVFSNPLVGQVLRRLRSFYDYIGLPSVTPPLFGSLLRSHSIVLLLLSCTLGLAGL